MKTIIPRYLVDYIKNTLNISSTFHLIAQSITHDKYCIANLYI